MQCRFLLSAGALGLLLAGPLAAVPPTPAQIAAETAKANAFFDRVFDEGLARSPLAAGYLGLKQGEDKWDDFSEQHAVEDLALTVQHLAELKRDINFAALDDQAKVSYRLFVAQSEDAIEGWRWRYHGYLFTQSDGMHIDAPAFLINFHPIDNVTDAHAYVARLRGFPPMFDQLIAGAKIREARGILPPRFVFPLLISASRQVITGAPFDDTPGKSALWADFTDKVGALHGVDAATKEQLLADGRAALLAAVKPAYERLIALFAAEEKVATDDDDVWKLPDGAEYYNYLLRQNTTTNLTADQIYKLGLREVARIQAELRAIKDRVGFKGDLAAFMQFARTDPQFYYPNTAAGRAAYVKRATGIIDAMRARLPEFFTVLPKAKLVIKEVEPFRQEGAAAAFYEQGSADGTRPGIYYINTFDMKGLPIWEMETLAHHEAIPGHHLQLSLALEQTGLPKFRRFNSDYTAYVEGWAVYSEYFPKEYGFYADPYMDFGRLADEILRAARLVVDTGIHARHWTRAQVVDYLRRNTPDTERDIDTEASRYIVGPAQATAYKIGELKILELRELARKELGPKFDIREYHDLVLKNGALPLTILEENVRAWIAARKA